MKKIRTIIIDDEQSGIANLQIFIAKYCPNLEIIKTISDSRQAVSLLGSLKPDLLFLDIEMPFFNGFDILDKYGEVNFDVIFVTAFNQYAIRAFRYSAIDYLLKPVNFDELKIAVEKIENKFILEEFYKENKNIQHLLQNIKEKDVSKHRLIFSTPEGEQVIMVGDILYVEAKGSYSVFHLLDKKIMSSKYLKEYEEILPADKFCRVHHSFLVNIDQIKTYKPQGRRGLVEFANKEKIEVSIRKKAEFLSLYHNK